MLEVIDKGSCSAAHPVPLLFVHGGWHGAWCWDDHFLDFFADAGYRAVALSLRGHGTSPTDKPLQHVSIEEYLDDIRSVADDLSARGGHPVLIGHSLGGYLTQRYLEDRVAPAAVLVGSLPPSGVLRAALRVWSRRPQMTIKSLHDPTLVRFLSSAKLAREYLFCKDTPEAIVLSCWDRAGPESIRAAMTEPMFRRVKTKQVTTPILVLGATHDGFVSRAQVRTTARAYATKPEFFTMGHNMMLEPGWRPVAERIDSWLGSGSRLPDPV